MDKRSKKGKSGKKNNHIDLPIEKVTPPGLLYRPIVHLFMYITCFLTGAIILILEVLGFRLLAPYFGLSVYVSGSLIGIILTSLSIGYYLGGKIADKWPDEKIIYYSILASAVYLTAIYLFYILILKFSQHFGIITGTIISTILIFAVPMTLLSIVSPYLIKLLGTHEKLGQFSGAIFSISTLGSILGSFLGTFVLIPTLGSNKTLLLCVILTYMIPIFRLALLNKKYALLAIIIPVVFFLQYKEKDSTMIYETESFYNVIRIYEENGLRFMVLNNPAWEQSYKPKTVLLNRYEEYFNLAPILTKVDSVLILGMSAGASVHELKYFFNHITIDAVEIDPKVVELAEKYFDIKEDNKLKIYTEDAKTFLIKTDKQYDFIEIDLFQGGPEIPFYVATKEFFHQVYDHTSANGIIMMNVIGTPQKKGTEKLVYRVANTVSEVFNSVYLFPVGWNTSNTLVIATKNKTNLEALKQRLSEVSRNTALRVLADKLNRRIIDYKKINGIIFTDDKSDVELVTHEVVEKLTSLSISEGN